MATLNLTEITRPGKEDRAKLLVNKVFQKSKQENNFMTTKGLFYADKLYIDGIERKYSTALVKNIVSLKGTRSVLELEGKFAGKRTKTKVKLNELEKTKEFGGQSTGVDGKKKVNLGIVFEKEFVERLEECVSNKKCGGKYSKQASKLLQTVSKAKGSAVKKIVHAGGGNQKRPIVLSGKVPLIEPKQAVKHGEKLTDITLVHANGSETYLSLKYGPSVTFINAGVAKDHFIQDEMKEGLVKSESGKAILDAFGIDNSKFCKVFNDYGKTGGKKPVDPHKETISFNSTLLKPLLQTAIGANYWMIHALENGKVFMWEVSKQRNTQYAKISGDATIFYGGIQGRGKRIDVQFSNQYFDFQMNIRNKQSGLYPSHIMLDYTSKPATGKEEL